MQLLQTIQILQPLALTNTNIDPIQYQHEWCDGQLYM